MELCRVFYRAGHNVILAESFPIHMLKWSKIVKKCYLVPKPRPYIKEYIGALIKIIKKEKIDILVPGHEEIFYITKQFKGIIQVPLLLAVPSLYRCQCLY